MAVQIHVDKAARKGQNPAIPLTPMTNLCKHPQVRVVAREDDVEFVECQTCREVFDAAEYIDMANEEDEERPGEAGDAAATGPQPQRRREPIR